MFWLDYGGVSFEWQDIKFKMYPKLVHELKRHFKEINRIPKQAITMQEKGRQLDMLLDRWNEFSDYECETELFATRWEITAETWGQITRFVQYVAAKDLLSTRGIERQIRMEFDYVDYAQDLLPVLNDRSLMFNTRLFQSAIRIRAKTSVNDDHKSAFIQVMNAFGHSGPWTKRNLTEAKLEKYWSDWNVLDEFEEDLDCIDMQLRMLKEDHDQEEDEQMPPEYNVTDEELKDMELALMQKHLCMRRRRTRKENEQGWQILNAQTGRAVPGWWETQEEVYEFVWDKAGTDWRSVYKTKRNPVPLPLKVVVMV
jgi:hypothetical protein